jgi:hypothetical protein
MSNLRIVKGTGVYTTTFTPSTTPLTAITNTSLLTCQSTTIKDNSTNALTITVSGSPKPYNFNPFGYTAQSATSYTPSIHGGSMYSKGVNQYLTIPANNNFLFYGDYTIECWVYFVSALNSDTDLVSNADGNNQPSWLIMMVSSGTIQFYPAGYSYYVNSGITPTLGQWYHIAGVRSGTTTSLYVNGVLSGSPATSQTAATYGSATKAIHIYSRADGNNTNPAYIADVRITNGVAIYKSNFVPPAQALTNYSITNPTSLLLNFTNGGIIDQHSSNVLETVGNAQLSTSVKKYNVASMSFDGSGDYLTSPSSPNYQFGTGNYTIEAWIYPTNWSSSGSNNIVNIGTYITGLMIRGQSTSGIEIYTNNAQRLNLTTGITANTWQHIALVRNGSACTFYVNGSSIGTFTDSSSIAPTAAILTIGMAAHNSSEFYTGYIDDLRITKGYARYTANFTAPTSALITK